MLIDRRVFEAAGVVGILATAVAAAIVELHHLLECRAAAVVEVRPGQRNVAQGRGLEGTINRITEPDVGFERGIAGDRGAERDFKGADVDIQRVGNATALQHFVVLTAE